MIKKWRGENMFINNLDFSQDQILSRYNNDRGNDQECVREKRERCLSLYKFSPDQSKFQPRTHHTHRSGPTTQISNYLKIFSHIWSFYKHTCTHIPIFVQLIMFIASGQICVDWIFVDWIPTNSRTESSESWSFFTICKRNCIRINRRRSTPGTVSM